MASLERTAYPTLPKAYSKAEYLRLGFCTVRYSSK